MIRHGTVSGYVNLPCRQACCRAAMAAYRRAHRQRVRGQVPPEVPHGLASTQENYGCGCRACLDASAAKQRRLYAQRKEAASTPGP